MASPVLQSFTLKDRVTVITGGARGLGLVMGYAAVESGSELAIVDLNVEEAKVQSAHLTEQFKEEHPESPVPKISAHMCNVADADIVSTCLDEILRQHGKVDNLITSAGFAQQYPAEEYPPEAFDRVFKVNVNGTYFWAQAVGRHLMERNAPGSIVMIGSMSSSVVNIPQQQAPYNGSKAAVRHLAASLAVEWATKKIRVNCISPGYMRTALTEKILQENPELNDLWKNKIPTGEMGEPDDLKGAAVFLLSNASRYITGVELRVDGGYTLV